MSEYVSIKAEVLQKLKDRMPEIRERFGIETLGIFGSVARGEDTENSDVDVLYSFTPGIRVYQKLLALGDYLEALFGRKVDLVGRDWISPYLREMILSEEIAV